MRPLLKRIREETEAEECDNAGLHIHVSKTCFGRSGKEQAENAAKLLYFYAAHAEDLLKIGRRRSFFRCVPPAGKTKEEALKYAVMMWNRQEGYERETRYTMLNLKNKYTAEFRGMRTTLSCDDLLGLLELTFHLVKRSRVTAWEDAGKTEHWLEDLPPRAEAYVRRTQNGRGKETKKRGE